MHPTPSPLTPALPHVLARHGICPLPHLGVIQLTGDDAAKFIHGQLTQDFSLLGLDAARLAGFCSPKGRLLASFMGFKRPQGDILLVCAKDLLAPTLKRLSMFVMRAKCTLVDASAQFAVFGLVGDATKPIAATAVNPWAKADFEHGSVVQLYPAMGLPRQLCVQTVGSPAPVGDMLDTAYWQWLDVRSGVATVQAAVVDALVPQMLNYESVGGVNFKKGCYPGQEVVARSQFRGTLKRRACIVHGAGPLHAGQEIFTATDASQPTGLVVQSAAAPDGGWDAIACVQTSAMGQELVCTAGDVNTQLSVVPLPYSLLEDI